MLNELIEFEMVYWNEMWGWWVVCKNVLTVF